MPGCPVQRGSTIIKPPEIRYGPGFKLLLRCLCRRDGSSQAEEIAVDAESANLALDDFAEDRLMPTRFPRVNVRHVNLDDGYREDRERIADSIAVMGPCARVDDDPVEFLDEAFMNFLAHRAFAVRLEAHHFHAELLPKPPQ